ncbi:MAG: MobF family relaxase, partial [Nitrosomonas ureae]
MLTTKSLGKAGSGSASYYENLSIDDYYEAGFELAGEWHGRLAGALGLSEKVQAGQLRQLFEGFNPVTGSPLASNAGSNSHKAGYDLCFSCPKSVSVAWAMADDEMQQKIAHAHELAVKASLDYLERNAFSGRDRNGSQPLKGIVAATYQHGTSRELDPQLHTHCVVANLGLREDGTVCAVDFDSRFKLVGGGLYRAEMCHQLKKIGLDIERDGKSFRLTQIPDKLCKTFSKRRSQIVEYIQQTGFTSAKSHDIAALATRKTKVSPSRSNLRANWAREAEESGYSQEQIKAMLEPKEAGQLDRPSHPPTITDEQITEIITRLTHSQAVFTRQAFEAEIAITAQGIVGAEQIPKIIARAIESGIADPGALGLIRLQEKSQKHDSRRQTILYTTREMLELEQASISSALQRSSERKPDIKLPDELLLGLSTEQADSVRHLVLGTAGIACTIGIAGSGKSYMLGRAKKAWEAEGLTVLGASLSSIAAAGLQQGSGISSQTLHSLIADIENGHQQLTDRHVVVLDESGMIGSKMLFRLQTHIDAVGGKLVMTGDPRQLQAIESGALFRGIAERIGYSSLSEIKRQANVDDRQMIKHLIDGRSEEVIEQLSQAGQLVVKRDDQIIETMVRDWQANRDPARPGESLMLAGTKSDVAALNRCARDLLKSEHRLHSEITISTESGEQEFCIGERVLFTRNHKSIGLRNGEKGTLTDWRLNTATGNVELTVMKDDGERVTFEPSQYGYISHAYAVSVHKAQGSTCDQVSVLMSENMGDREWSYVALSRHRQRLRVFVPESVGGDLENKLSRSRQKSLASDYQVPVKQVASDIELEHAKKNAS